MESGEEEPLANLVLTQSSAGERKLAKKAERKAFRKPADSTKVSVWNRDQGVVLRSVSTISRNTAL